MKLLHALVPALALVSTATSSAQMQLVWEDTFDGTSLDTSKWEAMVGDGCPNLCGWGNNELQYYRAENAVVSNGTLKIFARRENFGGREYTSARLRTANLGDWQYGRFEMRARLPAGRGLWPAFWMLPTDSVYGIWAASGEIDIMEALGQDTDRIFGTIHYGGQFPNNTFSGNGYTLPSGTFTDGFHEFAIEWEPTQIRWYVDDLLYATQSSWWSSGGPYPAPFDRRFHLLLNLAVGGNLPGPPDSFTPFPAVYEIDYVRVYQDVPHDPSACECVFDDMEHADPYTYGWFDFDASTAAGDLSANQVDVPPGEGGGASLAAAWSNIGFPGYLGGFGRTRPIDITGYTHFEMWVNPDPDQDCVIDVNLQDDDDGDDAIPGQADGADDEFQYSLTVGPAGSGADLVSGGGWQKVEIPIADFVDDNSYHFGGNGVFDPTPTSAGGNGRLVNVVLALHTNTDAPVTLRTDRWALTRRASSIGGRLWNDENRDGVEAGDLGLNGVTLELSTTSSSDVLQTVVTAGNGDYAFEGLAPGSYRVRVDTSTLPVGASPVADPDGLGSPHSFVTAVSCDEALSGLSFGYDPQTLGTPVCSPAVPNSSGSPGQIVATGSIFAADDDLTLSCASLPANSLGYFVVSPTEGFVPNAGGSQGALCVVGQVGRYVGPGQVLNAGALGVVSLPLDLGQIPRPTGSAAVQPGETWYFQYWHRDANPSSTSNFTDAVALRFQ